MPANALRLPLMPVKALLLTSHQSMDATHLRSFARTDMETLFVLDPESLADMRTTVQTGLVGKLGDLHLCTCMHLFWQARYTLMCIW